MAILEVEHHWITELVREHQSKRTTPMRVTVCDQCGLDGLLPNQLHKTLYAYDVPLAGRPITKYLCEVHMILKGGRPPTPEFIRAVRNANRQSS